MSKQSNPFAGIKLSDQGTPAQSPGLDQRLFSSPTPPPTVKQASPEKHHSQEVGKQGSRETVKEVSQPGSREGSRPFDIDARPFRKDSFLFTNEEFEALEDLKLDLRRKFDLKATKNDLARCALHLLIEDYQRNGEGSVAVRRLKRKGSR